jgi:hypothetical protein
VGGVTPGRIRIVPEIHILYAAIVEEANYRDGAGLNLGLGFQFDL